MPGGDGRVFRGWKIVASGSAIQVLIAALFLQAYGAYVVLIEADLEWSRTMLAAGFSLARSESALLGPLQGHLIDRLGARRIMRTGAITMAIGFLTLSAMSEPWHFFVALAFIALGSSFAGFMSVTTAVVQWFSRYRAAALGLSSTGTAIGGLFIPLVAFLLVEVGWRTGAAVSGVVLLVLGPLLVQPIRSRPSEVGEHVDGIVPDARRVDGAREGPQRRATAWRGDDQQMTAKQALRTPEFWYLSIAHFTAVLLVSALMVHLIPHLTGTFDYSLADAGLIVAALTLMQLVGKFIGSAIGDGRDKKRIIATTMMMHVAGAALLVVASSPWIAVVFAGIHGTAWGIRGPIINALRADLFGSRHYGSIMGYSSLIVMFGAAGGPLLAGYCYDVFGGYTQAFMILGAGVLVGLVLVVLLRPARTEPTRVG